MPQPKPLLVVHAPIAPPNAKCGDISNCRFSSTTMEVDYLIPRFILKASRRNAI